MEFNAAAEKQLAELESKYGLPKAIELYTPDGQKQPVTVKDNAGVIINSGTPQLQTFAIIEFSDQMRDLSNRAKLDDDVFTIVEETATPNGGLTKFYQHIANTMFYPAEARKKGVVGKVFVEFVVQEDGSITNVKVLNGIGMGCDEEAMRAIASFPDKWIPGKNEGIAVKQRMVLPITFKLNGENSAPDNNGPAPKGSIHELVVEGQKPNGE